MDRLSETAATPAIFRTSLNHAVTAAVLRNGYLSNRTSPSPNRLRSIFPPNVCAGNERHRRDACRSEPGALLGYQLERGLHDRHDTEVIEFIYDLRLAFPLQANQMQSTHTDEAAVDRADRGAKCDQRPGLDRATSRRPGPPLSFRCGPAVIGDSGATRRRSTQRCSGSSISRCRGGSGHGGRPFTRWCRAL